MKTRLRPAPRGYILPLTLGILVMMAIVGAAVGEIARATIDKAQAAKRRVDADYELAAARAKVLHMLAVLPRTDRGIGVGAAPIRADGRAYLLDGSVIVRIQDLRGLLPLNPSLGSQAGQTRLESLLKSYGITEPTAQKLVSTLQDYRDSDDLQRVNGADGPNAIVPLPIRNEDLLAPTELYRIAGWREASGRWKSDPLERYVDVHRAQAFNPNVAPARVLSAVAGIRLADAQALVKDRLTNPDLDLAPVLFSTLDDPFGSAGFVVRFTGASLRVSLQHRNNDWAQEMVVHHTPGELSGPWRISRNERIAASRLRERDELPPGLPKLSELRPMIERRIELKL